MSAPASGSRSPTSAFDDAGLVRAGVETPTPPAYFRGVEQVYEAMRELARQHPDLVSVESIGSSWLKQQGRGGHDILAMTIGSRTGGPPKPLALYTAGVHAREIGNPELLMRFATDLVKAYGSDDNATRLLDGRRIALVPIVNPDGHAIVEQGYVDGDPTKLNWRGNANTSVVPYGTDLNRNFGHGWDGRDATADPRSTQHPGAGPDSEPETQAVERYIRKTKPNIVMDFHSFGNGVIYPWGYTSQAAPDGPKLAALAAKFASVNHSRSGQMGKLGVAHGTFTDWAYGAAEVPAFAVESAGSKFLADDSDYQQLLSQNVPLLWHATEIANDPYGSAGSETAAA